MKPLNHCLLAAACVLLPVFTASRCAAQDTDRLLHAGMLGLTMDEEPEAAKAPLAISGPTSEEKTRWSDRSGAVIRYRIGGLKFKNDIMTAMVKYVSDPGIVPLLGVSIEGDICDYFSTRGSFDLIYGFGSFQQEDTAGEPLEIWIDGEFTQLTLKYTALFHLPPRTLWSNRSGYFHPYIGLGVEFAWLSQTIDVNNRADISVALSMHANGFGVHAVTGAEYVFDGWSIGVELAWSAVEVNFRDGDASLGVDGRTDVGGTTLLFNIGYDF